MSAEVHARLRSGEAIGRARIDELLAAAGEAEATWHPTGFMVAKLWSSPAGTLRLHVWPARARCFGDPLWPVHDHVWPLCSQVLVGEVHCRDAVIVDDPGGDARRYAVDYRGGPRSRLVAEGPPVRLRLGAPHRVEAGERYDVPAGAFHTSAAPADRFAATLVAVGPAERRRPFVIGERSGPADVDVVRRHVEPGRWRAVLKDVCARYSAASASTSSAGS